MEKVHGKKFGFYSFLISEDRGISRNRALVIIIAIAIVC